MGGRGSMSMIWDITVEYCSFKPLKNLTAVSVFLCLLRFMRAPQVHFALHVQLFQKLLSKLKDEADQICQAPAMTSDPKLEIFEGDPYSEIKTLSEAKHREYVLRETLKQVQLRTVSLYA
ncbi:uncharacterized protein LOC109798077 [Cajanus cajan]|uniref:uncharacterized protein LOC109798077 n=1 Tax=Cajanus cajan TaxID=3821 RepID=UPI0010FB46CF|nr:uncharacterized protein LOC109798077 [Cajanus cajan]